MSAGVQVKLRDLVQQTVSSLTRAIGFPRVVADESEPVLGQAQSPEAETDLAKGDGLPSGSAPSNPAARLRSIDDLRAIRSAPHDQPERLSDVNTSVDTLAEQMLTLVEIVSAQERDINALKEQCRRLEEHDQAIAVAFSTFFHVLSAGRIAKMSEITAILNNIIQIAEQEGRPTASIEFLQDLADMLSEDQG